MGKELTPEYIRYIKSTAWFTLSKRIRKRDRVCQGCGVKNNLDVHHKTYTHFMEERDDELVLVCRKCHDAIHKAYSSKKYGKRLSRTTDKILAIIRSRPSKVTKKPSKKSQRNTRRKALWESARNIEEAIKNAKSTLSKTYL